MAGGIDWFRWHHGSVTDPKFKLVAKRAGASLADVLAVWAYLLEKASASERRGTFGKIDTDSLDCMFGFPDTETRSADILKALRDRGLIEDGGRVSFQKRYFVAPTLRLSSHLWKRIRQQVFIRDDLVCQYCGVIADPAECDHVIPVADGGSHELSNLVTACRPCNRSKGARSPKDWKRRP